mmetsp:Transcript_3780/g.12344  ORF Transcript_3780/g.12344 Transcript_3780/m.12344 type:complete len:210 (-) Transcript_3780:573-1202(-)
MRRAVLARVREVREAVEVRGELGRPSGDAARLLTLRGPGRREELRQGLGAPRGVLERQGDVVLEGLARTLHRGQLRRRRLARREARRHQRQAPPRPVDLRTDLVRQPRQQHRLAQRGRVLFFSSRRLRQRPPDGGGRRRRRGPVVVKVVRRRRQVELGGGDVDCGRGGVGEPYEQSRRDLVVQDRDTHDLLGGVGDDVPAGGDELGGVL